MHVQQVRLHNTDFKHRQWCKTHKATQWFLKGRGLFCSNQMNHLNLTQQRMLKTKLDPQKTAWQSILKEETQLCFLLMIAIICPITCEPFKIFVKCLELKLNHFQHINMVGDKYEDFEMIVSAQKKEKIKNTHKLGQFTIIVQGDRCNITGCTFVQKGRCVVSEEQVATDDISQENTRMHTERRPWTNEVDLFNISDFFPPKNRTLRSRSLASDLFEVFSKCTYGMNLKFHISQVIMFKRFSENLISYLDLEV